MRHQDRGLTLAEIVVCCFLLGMLTTSVYGIFSSSMRYSQTTHAAVDLQSSALKAVRKIVLELANSDFATISTPPGANAIIFAIPLNGMDRFPQNATTFGNQWQSWVCYGADSQGNLRRSMLAIVPPSSTPPNAASAPSLAALQAAPDRVVAAYVDMQASNPLTFTLDSGRVSIIANFAESLQTESRCQIVDEVYCRN